MNPLISFSRMPSEGEAALIRDALIAHRAEIEHPPVRAVLRPEVAAPIVVDRAVEAPRPSQESLELLRACECPVGMDPLLEAVTLVPCCHKVNQAVAEHLYGRMEGDTCARRDQPCVICRTPVRAYYADNMVRDLARRALGLAEPRPIPIAPAAPVMEARRIDIPPAREARAPIDVRRAAIEARASRQAAEVAEAERVAEEARVRGIAIAAAEEARRVADEAARHVEIPTVRKEALVIYKLLHNEVLYNRLKEREPRLIVLANELEGILSTTTPSHFPVSSSSELLRIKSFALYFLSHVALLRK